MRVMGDKIDNMKPKRIQRKRAKGWRMPDNTVSVCRPHKWGNPFKIVDDFIVLATKDGGYLPIKYMGGKSINAKHIKLINYFEGLINGVRIFNQVDITGILSLVVFPDLYEIRELKGKDLACFCRLDQPCHADVLLEIANEEVS